MKLRIQTGREARRPLEPEPAAAAPVRRAGPSGSRPVWSFGRRLLLRMGVLGTLAGGLLTGSSASANGTGTAQVLMDYQFAEQDQGFTTYDFCQLWAWGSGANAPKSLGEGPYWATTESFPDGGGSAVPELQLGYVTNCPDSELLSPLLSMQEHPDLTLALVHYYDTVAGDDTCPELLAGGDDTACGDGGLLLVRNGEGEQILTPSSGYDRWIVYQGQAVKGFSGGPSGTVTSYFDLLGLTDQDLQLELLFTSTSDLAEGLGWQVKELILYEGDIVPPSVGIENPLGDTPDVVGPYVVEAQADDNRGLSNVTLTYRIGQVSTRVAMTPVGDGTNNWRGTIPGQPTGTDVQYSVTAVDLSSNSITYPVAKDLTFRVKLAAPLGLAFADSPLPAEATSLDLSWQPPYQPGYKVEAYEVFHSIVAADGSLDELGTVADTDGRTDDLFATVAARGYPFKDQYTVRAMYDVGGESLVPGDWSKSAVVDTAVIVPSIVSMSPSTGYQSFPLSLTIVGAYTSFVQGDLSIDLGAGVQVDESSLVVRDVSYCTVSVQIAADAVPGRRDLTLHWPKSDPSEGLTIVYPNALTIVSSDERPQIVSLSEDHVFRKENKDIKFTGAFTDFDVSRPSVVFGSGILANEVKVISATEFQVSIQVSKWADLGERSITVVSGDQVFQVSLWVEEHVAPIGSCSCSEGLVGHPNGGSLPVLALMMCAQYLLRRRRAGEFWLRGDYALRRTDSEYSDSTGPGGHDAPGSAGSGQLGSSRRSCQERDHDC